MIISMMLECELNDSGCEVIGPTPSVEAALRLIDEERLDCALLDYQLGDETSGRIASVLAERNIPFLLMTGHCAGDLPLELRDKTLLRKPVTGKALRAALEAILNIAA
ncbi:response regulator [Methylocystis rosea]|uniref:response regulator n=1 Tax=Methylocystis rosea TaxID=173366 RepID=UPI0013DE201F|nr:response regulator [Methylocystis rosea]